MNPTELESSPPEARPRLDPRVSWLFLALWAAVMAHGWGGLATRDSTAQLQYPVSTAGRLTSRTLELAFAIDAAPPGERQFWQRFEATPEEALQNAIAIHDDVIATLEGSEAAAFESDSGEATSLDLALAGLAVLLAESGQTAEALSEAERVTYFGDYAGLLARLYDGAAQSTPDPDAAPLELVTRELESWPSDRLQLRAAELSGDEGSAQAIRAREEARGRSWFTHTRTLFFTNWGLVLLGVLVIAGWLGLHGANAESLRGPPQRRAPWSFADGLGVLVRGDFYSRLYFVLLELPYSVAVSPLGEVLFAAGTPLASLPMFWLIYRHLIAPHRATHPDPFGLSLRRIQLGAIAGFTLAAIAAEILGTQAIGWTSFFLELASPWSEGFDETLVWASTREMWRTSLDYVVWIPAVEELTFRGLLFFTLRRRLGVLSAALVSSTIFSAVHFYSFTGFLTTFWSGMVWALVFERVRSLIPGIAAHAVYNGLYVASLLLLYR